MTGCFEVSAIKGVRAACPVCDPVANIYGPAPGGSRSSLPSCPAFSVRGLGGRSAPSCRAAPVEGADLWCSDAGLWGSRPAPAAARLAPRLALGQGRGRGRCRRGTVRGLPAHPSRAHTHLAFLRRCFRAEASLWESRSPKVGRPSGRGRTLRASMSLSVSLSAGPLQA